MDVSAPPEDRPAAIAAAAVRVIARDGLRALTHRAVDREAGIPQGSTSYYASTRRALLAHTIDHLALRTLDEAGRAVAQLDAVEPAAERAARARQLAALAAGFLALLAGRADDMRARYALLIDLAPDDELHVRLAGGSVVQETVAPAIARVLERFGAATPERRAVELLRLADALTLSRIALGGADAEVAEGVLVGYLSGILDR